MAYTTVANVEAEFKSIDFSVAGAAVTTGEVVEFISQADAHINGKIGRKYTVPVTATESLIILKTISTWMVADRVRKIAKVKDISLEELQQGLRPPGGRKEALEMVEQITDGTLLLSDAPLINTEEGLSSFGDDNALEFQFQRNVDQW